MRVLIDGWANLPKSELDFGQMSKLRDQLTIQPRKTSEHQEMLMPLKLYEETTEVFRVPREWFFKNQTTPHGLTLEVSDGAEIPEERARIAETYLAPEGDVRRFQLREEQVQALEAISKLYAKTHENDPKQFGISLQAPTGWGKTVLAAAVISRFRRKMLVVVNKEFLLDQWMKRLQMVMPKIKVGVIQGDKCELDADVCVGIVQSLALWKKELDAGGETRYPKSLVDEFGLMLCDEEHRMAAPTWITVAPALKARFRIGLTATPYRKDGCANAFFWHLGHIGFEAKEKRMTPVIKKVLTGFELQYTPHLGDMSKATKEKLLAGSKMRNRLIAEKLCEAVVAGRCVLVLAATLAQLDHIAEDFKKLRYGFGVKEEVRCDFYVGGRKQSDLDAAGNADVIFGTYKMAEEGLDLPWVDTLFLASPKSDVVQAVGRILRPFEGKKQPLVADFIDNLVDEFLSMAERRQGFYKSLGSPMQIRKAASS